MLSAAWPQKQRFLELLRRALADAPARPTWYPGANARVEEAAQRSRATLEGDCVLVPGLDINDAAETALHEEWFAPVLGVAELAGDDPATFLRAAVDAANERLHGTLGANLIAHPRSIRALGHTFNDAIAELRYGTIARQRVDRPRLPDAARDLGRVPRAPAHGHRERARRRAQRAAARGNRAHGRARTVPSDAQAAHGSSPTGPPP